VHNKHVVATLRERGAVFVDELDDTIPEGAITVFSAHGVSPAVHADAEQRRLRTIDATCPLVTKVHREALKFAAEGYTIILIGHAGHEEVEGTMGEAPDHIVLVESEADVDALEVADEHKLAYISQTTLSVDETRTIIARLRERFPHITGPRTDDICYATTNRQAAVRQMAAHCDLVLVIGSTNSSNSNRLVDVARDNGAASYLIDGVDQVQEEWLEGARVVGISSGASAPEELVDAMARCILAEDPGAKVAPYLMGAGTDAKHFRRLGLRSYGFVPLRLPEDLDFAALFHGVDERVPVDSLEFGARVLDRFFDEV